MRSDLIATIDLSRLAHNLAVLRGCCHPGTKICAALKADAYGHGLQIVAPALHELGVEMAAVATLTEAVTLRRLGWERPILVLGNVLAVPDAAERRERAAAIAEHQLSATVGDREAVSLLSNAAIARQTTIGVHVKLDTGMGRQGLMPADLIDFVQSLRRDVALRIEGIYSHFATADLELRDVAQGQLEVFRDQLTTVSDWLPAGVTQHLANTAATLTWPETHFDMVRPGLGLYGYAPAEYMLGRFDLRPILRLTSHVTLVKSLPVGHGVGYGRTFVAHRSTRMGIVPAGYADGYLRRLTNTAVVGTSAGDAPVIGRVSMDQLAIDLTDLPGVGVGSEVVLIDDDPSRPNSVAGLARQCETIPYEITCLLGDRIDRVAISREAVSHATSS
jgi:alanine racemase